eukprot:Colp12_sorted_trinity150504_noHs@10969
MFNRWHVVKGKKCKKPLCTFAHSYEEKLYWEWKRNGGRLLRAAPPTARHRVETKGIQMAPVKSLVSAGPSVESSVLYHSATEHIPHTQQQHQPQAQHVAHAPQPTLPTQSYAPTSQQVQATQLDYANDNRPYGLNAGASVFRPSNVRPSTGPQPISAAQPLQPIQHMQPVPSQQPVHIQPAPPVPSVQPEPSFWGESFSEQPVEQNLMSQFSQMGVASQAAASMWSHNGHNNVRIARPELRKPIAPQAMFNTPPATPPMPASRLPADLRMWTKEDVATWLRSEEAEAQLLMFSKYDGKRLLRLNEQQMIQICGMSEGIRLYNALQDIVEAWKQSTSHTSPDSSNTTFTNAMSPRSVPYNPFQMNYTPNEAGKSESLGAVGSIGAGVSKIFGSSNGSSPFSGGAFNAGLFYHPVEPSEPLYENGGTVNDRDDEEIMRWIQDGASGQYMG